MDCACICVGDVDEPDFYKATMRTARKRHVCCECGDDIRKGDRYEEVTAQWDGPPVCRLRTCVDCLSVIGAFFCGGRVCRGTWEYLADHIDYCGGEISSAAIASLTPKARERVCEMIEGTWD